MFVVVIVAIAATRPVLQLAERAIGRVAALQQWWLAPVLGRLGELPLFFGAAALTAFNDNAAITYLASLVPNLSAGMKLAVVAGAVTGGGLTVIANAPNPAGQALLARHFAGGISPPGLLAGAAVPTLVMAALSGPALSAPRSKRASTDSKRDHEPRRARRVPAPPRTRCAPPPCGTEGTTAFGAASLAFLRFTHGPTGAAVALIGSLLVWMVVPVVLAARRLARSDL
jgi:hypothetical protein